MFSWITGLVDQAGYVGIALLMFAENLFPPIPSELIMPLAGFTAARGELNLVLEIVAGSVGSVVGALFWYYVGIRVGRDRLKKWAARHGRWLTVTPEEIDRTCAWFDRRGGVAVLIGRLVPAIRTLISIPAGIAEMPLLRFLAYSTVGTVLWTAFLTGAGYLLESQYHKVADWMDPASTAVVVVLVAGYVYRVATFDRRRRAKADRAGKTESE